MWLLIADMGVIDTRLVLILVIGMPLFKNGFTTIAVFLSTPYELIEKMMVMAPYMKLFGATAHRPVKKAQQTFYLEVFCHLYISLSLLSPPSVQTRRSERTDEDGRRACPCRPTSTIT